MQFLIFEINTTDNVTIIYLTGNCITIIFKSSLNCCDTHIHIHIYMSCIWIFMLK